MSFLPIQLGKRPQNMAIRLYVSRMAIKNDLVYTGVLVCLEHCR